MLEGGRSIFQLALNKYPHAFQPDNARQYPRLQLCTTFMGAEHDQEKGLLYRDVRDVGQWDEGRWKQLVRQWNKKS